MVWARAQEVWIVMCAALACAGWLFSAFWALGGTAYVIFFCIFGAGILVAAKRAGAPRLISRRERSKLTRRFRRFAPLLYLGLLIGSVLGALAYPTIHFDSLSYRVPRVLHWLAE